MDILQFIGVITYPSTVPEISAKQTPADQFK